MTFNPLVSGKKIERATLHRLLPLNQRLYIWPFSFLYILWSISIVYQLYFHNRFYELMLIPLSIIIISQFLTFMASIWSIRARAYLTCLQVYRIQDANYIQICPKEHYGKPALCPIQNQQSTNEKMMENSSSSLHFWFEYQQQKFTWNSDKKIFLKPTYPISKSIQEYLDDKGLIGQDFINETLQTFGKNRFDIKSPKFLELFTEHAVAPFFVFQVFCVLLWCLDEYWYYSLFTLFMLIIFESTVVQQRIRNIAEFRTMTLPTIKLSIKRNGKWIHNLSSEELLPGDIALIPEMEEEEICVPADMIILGSEELKDNQNEISNEKSNLKVQEGKEKSNSKRQFSHRVGVIVNEAMISGESTPLLKEPLFLLDSNEKENQKEMETEIENKIFNVDKDRQFLLYGGTKILQINLEENTDNCNQNEIKTKESNLNSNLNSTNSKDKKKQGLVVYVIRTGFGTTQGKLVRTMIYSNEQVTANNKESFLFILFLLIFAIAASIHVLIHGLKDPNKSKYKLLLDCILIITAVVPPELPMELSLAVNSSLQALSKMAIFCMEPFRIPLAGRLDICCFDKTGTLTEEKLMVQGVCTDSTGEITNKVNEELCLIISSCHSLFKIGKKKKKNESDSSRSNSNSSKSSRSSSNCKILGDPMEKAAVIDFLEADIKENDLITLDNQVHLKIIHRYSFSSDLKRMSVIVQQVIQGEQGGKSIISKSILTCKGAPETIRNLLVKVPSWYDSVYQKLAMEGGRILALAWKEGLSKNEINFPPPRSNIENNLLFAGFLVFKCPVKKDSAKAIKSLSQSGHQLMMITGDNILTAIWTAKELNMMKHPESCILIDTLPKLNSINNEINNQKINQIQSHQINTKREMEILSSQLDIRFYNQNENENEKNDKNGNSSSCHSLPSSCSINLDKIDPSKHSICITGSALDLIVQSNLSLFFNQLIPHISVFARASPEQKELILQRLKSLGMCTLMCGDGTNDVGALKQAHIGVALLDGRPEDLDRIMEQQRRMAMRRQQATMEQNKIKWQNALEEIQNQTINRGDENEINANNQSGINANNANLEKISIEEAKKREKKLMMQRQLEEVMEKVNQEETPMVRLGDASVAAPFTSKIGTIEACCDIIRQGRCTLVTTIQMYKILALNSLISAYSLSVLHLSGIRFGDFQVTITGMLLASCFLFLTRAKPIKKLSSQRPTPTILNWYLLSSVLGQTLIHLLSLSWMIAETGNWTFAYSSSIRNMGEKLKFAPSLTNTAIYLESLILQVSTFLVNYQGRPFRESLWENRPLRTALLIVMGIALIAACEIFPDFNMWLQLVPMPGIFRKRLLFSMLMDVMGCIMMEWMCYKLLFKAKNKIN